jgi:hypothetical protein
MIYLVAAMPTAEIQMSSQTWTCYHRPLRNFRSTKRKLLSAMNWEFHYFLFELITKI